MKIPAEAVDLYTRYIHGEISRRDFMDAVCSVSPSPALLPRRLSKR